MFNNNIQVSVKTSYNKDQQLVVVTQVDTDRPIVGKGRSLKEACEDFMQAYDRQRE